MGIRRKAVKKLVLAVAVPGMTLGTLDGFAAAPAGASTAQPHAPSLRYERISGYSNGLMNYLPVQVTGSFSDHGALHSTSANAITVNLTKGRQYLYFASEPTVSHVNSATCQVTLRGDTEIFVDGGTGQYADFYRYGTATITETGALPRVNGHCSTSSSVIPSTAHTTFVATAEVSRYLI